MGLLQPNEWHSGPPIAGSYGAHGHHLRHQRNEAGSFSLTPWRFRTKRNLWAYAGLAVVTESSADHEFIRGRPVRRQRRPLTRGLNKNHNPVLKDVFKGAATAALGRPGPLRDLYDRMVERGMRPKMARLTLARKFAALTLRLWKTGEGYDPTQLSGQAT